jgi:hypothetical protein
MTYIIEIGSGVMLYIPDFIEIVSGIQTMLRGGIHRPTESMVTS